jgi:hypothetical protein
MDCSFVSKWYPIFCRLGYPQLDVVQYEDGEWAIIEYDNAPIIPSMTRFHHVLKGLRHIEITEGFIKRWVEQLDPRKRFLWEREQKRTEEMELEKEAQEKHTEQLATDTVKVISKNEDLKERIAKYGIGELDLERIARHIPQQQLKEICKC